MTLEQAQGLVLEDLEKYEGSNGRETPVIDEARTITRWWGWVIYYESKAYLETRDPMHLLCGNSQYLVNRYTGDVIRVGGNPFSIERCIEEYESGLEIDT